MPGIEPAGNIGERLYTIALPRAGDTDLDTIRLLHFSDPHVGLGLGRVPVRDWPGKRLVGGMNLARGRGRRFRDAVPRLRALARFAEAERFDAAVCTGDVSALGTDAELDAAREVLEPFFEAPLGFVCLPGNHDLYTASVLRERRFDRRFAAGLASDLPELRVEGPFPLVRLLGSTVAVVAVNSARPNPVPWRSSGRVPDAQVRALREALASDAVRDRFVVIATHYAPRRADGTPDSRLHGLENADDLLAACAGTRRGALLCGHIHHAFRVAPDVGPEIFCAGSVSMEGHESGWCLEIHPNSAVARPLRLAGSDWQMGPAAPIAPPRAAPEPPEVPGCPAS